MEKLKKYTFIENGSGDIFRVSSFLSQEALIALNIRLSIFFPLKIKNVRPLFVQSGDKTAIKYADGSVLYCYLQDITYDDSFKEYSFHLNGLNTQKERDIFNLEEMKANIDIL